MQWRALALVISWGAVACSSSSSTDSEATGESEGAAPAAEEGQSVSDAWRAFCQVSREHDPRKIDPAQRMARIMGHVEEAVSNPDVSAFIESVAGLPPSERIQRMQERLAADGVTDCHLADYFARRNVEFECRLGDRDACVGAITRREAGALFPDEHPSRVSELRELACVHGHGESCAELGQDGMACRRGHAPSCSKGGGDRYRDFALELDRKGALPARILGGYQPAFEDCLVEQRKKIGDKGRVDLEIALDPRGRFRIEGGGTLRDCLRSKAEAWRFQASVEQPPAPVKATLSWDRAPTRAELKEAVAEAAIIKVLGDDGSQGVESVMMDRDSDTALADAIDRVKKTGERRVLGGDPKKTRSRVTIMSARSPDAAGIAEEATSRVRSRYARGLARCHERLLKKDPDEGGKVTLRIRIAATGRVVRAKASGFDRGVSECIESQAKRWRFPPPKNDGEPTEAELRLPLVFGLAD